MGTVWAYLKPEEINKYKQIAQGLDMSDGELTQLLIRSFLHIPSEGQLQKECAGCYYYALAQNEGIKLLQKANEFLTMVEPPYKRLIKNALITQKNR